MFAKSPSQSNSSKLRARLLALTCLLALIFTTTIATTQANYQIVASNTNSTLNNDSVVSDDSVDVDDDDTDDIDLQEAKINPQAAPTNVLYTTSNDPRGNSILMYKRNPTTGAISAKPDGVFKTGGKGYGSPDALVGPQDLDTPLITSTDKKFMFAVNMGSDDISVFTINSDGSLTAVPGSPFPSGGRNPVSLSYAKSKKMGTRLYVANKAQGLGASSAPHPSGDPPNYGAFTVSDTGQLTPVPDSFRKVNVGANPSQILATPNGKIVFALDLFAAPSSTPLPAPLAPFIPQRVSFIHSYSIDKKTGTMKELATSPTLPPNPNDALPFFLGMLLHPSQPILYVSLVARDQLGILEYDAKGNLKFLGVTPSIGVGQCWLTISPDQKFLYGTNTFDGTIESFDISDPRKPQQRFALLMREPGPPSPQQFPPFSSQPYQVQIDPTGKFLYFIAERGTIDFSFIDGNAIHVMTVGPNGSLSEPIAPVRTPIDQQVGPLGIFIQGIVVL